MKHKIGIVISVILFLIVLFWLIDRQKMVEPSKQKAVLLTEQAYLISIGETEWASIIGGLAKQTD